MRAIYDKFIRYLGMFVKAFLWYSLLLTAFAQATAIFFRKNPLKVRFELRSRWRLRFATNILQEYFNVSCRYCCWYLRSLGFFFQHVKNCVLNVQLWVCFGFLSHTQGTPVLAGSWAIIRDSRNAPSTSSLALLGLVLGNGVPWRFFVHCMPSHSSSFLHSSLHSSQLRALECPHVIPKLVVDSLSSSRHSLQSYKNV